MRERTRDLAEWARRAGGDRQDRRPWQRRGKRAFEDHEIPRPAILPGGRRAVLGGRDPEQFDVREVAQGRLEVRVTRSHEQDQAGSVGRDDGEGVVVDGQLVGRARDRRVRADEPDLERADTTWHVVDDDIGACLRVDGEIAHLE